MDAPQQNFINRVAIQARRAKDLMSLNEEIDVLYNGSPNYDTIITQGQIDSVPIFLAAGLTVAQLAAVVYCLKMINVQMTTIDFPALILLANIP